MAISKEKMKALEKRTIEEYKIDPLVLMENAGMGIFNEIKDSNSYTIICGTGNNGGDGLVIARHLILTGHFVEVFILGENKTPEFSINLEILEKLSEDIYFIEENNYDELIESLEVNEVCVDAIFGIGLNRNLEGVYLDVVDIINKHGNFIVSVDIPTGIDADTGDEYKNSVVANETYAISEIKLGETLNINVGKLVKVYIGIVRYKDE